jgi:small conductance mechanosensitive channel
MRLDLLTFSLLQTAQQPEDTVNIADSTKAEIAEVAQEIVNDPGGFFTDLGKDAIQFGLKVLAAIVVYIIGAWIIKKVKKLMAKGFQRRKTSPTLATFVTSLVSITLTVLLIIIVIGTLGINTTSLAALLAAGGMAIGMALSGTVQNFAGGLMILMFKPFKVGDYITAQGQEGYVVEVNIVSTKIRTFANSIIILPNGSLFNGTIDNFSDKPYHRITWKVDLSYGCDSQKAREVILGILGEDKRILHKQKSMQYVADPSIHIELKESCVEFVVWAWTKTDDYWSAMFDIQEKIYKVLPEQGFSFPFPQMDVHLDQKA